MISHLRRLNLGSCHAFYATEYWRDDALFGPEVRVLDWRSKASLFLQPNPLLLTGEALGLTITCEDI